MHSDEPFAVPTGPVSGMPPSIGPYRIVGLLGEGGMGTVYEAQQEQPSRRVALKVIRPDFVLPNVVQRFTREAEVLGRLQHPGIAQIYQAGTFESAGGARPYFAMELVKGETLTQYANTHTFDISARLALFAKVCDAVHYAHQQGVVHRDLKPANILVTSEGQPKILDFGVALFTDHDMQATRQTSFGEMVGTLQYMSPEQVNADTVTIDARSDVYSLGVILYELMSGRLPYDLSQRAIYDAVRMILVDEPAPLSSANRTLRGDVEVIVGKALEKERQRRYGSAEELASDVRRYLNDEPISARRASAAYQLRKFARRNRPLVTGLAFGAVVLVVGTIVSASLAVRASAAERIAEARREEAVAASALAERRRAVADDALRLADSARTVADSATANALRQQAAAMGSAARANSEAAKATAVNSFLQDMLGSSDPSNARGKDLTVRELLDRAAVRIDSGGFSTQPEVRAGLERTIGRTYFALGLYEQARPRLESAYNITQRVYGPANVVTSTSGGDLGEMYRASGNFPEAERLITPALAAARARLAPDDDQVTGLISTLAAVKYSLGRNDEAERLHREALALTKRRYGGRGVVVATRLQALGTFLLYTGRPADALPIIEEGLVMRRAAYGNVHPQVVGSLMIAGDARRILRKFAEAESTYREALTAARQLFGQSHPSIADLLSRLGGVLSDMTRPALAEPLIREAIAMRIALLGEQHPDVQLSRVELGRLLQNRGSYDEAGKLFTEALTARRALLGNMSPAVAASLQDLGYLSKLREQWTVVEQRYREALPIWTAAKIEEEVLRTQGEIGFALSKQGKFDEAEVFLRDVVVRAGAKFGSKHWFTGDVIEKLSAVEFGRGRIAKAESLGAEGLAIRRAVYGPRSMPVAGQLQNMAFYKQALNDTASAVPIWRESLGMISAMLPNTDRNVVMAQRMLAMDLCTTGALAEGDSLLRRAVASTAPDTTQPLIHRLRASLGYCLVRAKRYPEAEPLLIAAERSLGAIPNTPAAYRAQVITALVDLYERWGRPTDAQTWKARK